MTALSDWIAANPVLAWSAIQTDDDWLFLRNTMHGINDVLFLVAEQGWTTEAEARAAMEPLADWAQYITPPVLEDLGSLGIDRDSMPEESWVSVLGDISFATAGRARQIVALDQYGDRLFSDAEYGLLTKAQLIAVAAASPSSALPYAAETMDCDDFSRVMSGWLAANGLGNTAIGVAALTIYVDDVATASHAALLAVTADHRVWWVEPQNGHVYDLHDLYMLPDANRVVITDLFF